MNLRERYLPALETEMKQLVTARGSVPEQLYGMLRYHLGWATDTFEPTKVDAGKRIRPTILLLVTEAQGGDWQQGLPAAAAIELLHNFTLIHDDIEDHDEMRRGRPTVWAHWGVPQAINAGDALYAISYRGIRSLGSRGVPADRIVQALDRYTETVIQVIEGQCEDLAFESEDLVDEEDYLQMIQGKTAALIGLAAELGAIVVGAPHENRVALREFGEALGKTFQMQDDLLGLWGDPEKTGKPVASDLRQRKKTLPILHGMHKNPALRQMLLTPSFGESDIPHALRLLEEAGSRAYTLDRAQTFHDQALAALATSGGTGPAQVALKAMAEGLIGREK